MTDQMAGVTIRDDRHVGERSAACARRAWRVSDGGGSAQLGAPARLNVLRRIPSTWPSGDHRRLNAAPQAGRADHPAIHRIATAGRTDAAGTPPRAVNPAQGWSWSAST